MSDYVRDASGFSTEGIRINQTTSGIEVHYADSWVKVNTVKFKVGDYVRIKRVDELNVQTKNVQAIREWQDRTAIVIDVRPSIVRGRYKIQLVDQPGESVDSSGHTIDSYLWYDYELDLFVTRPDIDDILANSEIDQTAYDELLGGIE